MNDVVKITIKKELKKGLLNCTEAQQNFFKKIFSYKNQNLSIDDVIDLIKDEKLEGALQLVERTSTNNKNKKRAAMKQAKYSSKDSRGSVWVDCTECNRGVNGKDVDKCSAGHKHKIGGRGGCFIGKLIDGLEINEREK